MDNTVAILPASPALTDFDSLDGIEDLDAFLDAKGGLSRFPTPPLKDKTCIHVGIIEDVSEDESEDEVDELDIAAVFARELSGPGEPFWDDILAIEDLLLRAHMPIEIVALAFGILSKFLREPRALSEDKLGQPLAGPLITATVSIATLFNSDHPPPTQYWATHVGQPPVVAKYLDRLELKVLEALDWRLLRLSRPDAIAETLRLFERRREVPDSPPNDVELVKPDRMDFASINVL
ncbi:hypothetical protein B0A48_17515 [Cryoendolithus antarcticus]|uniref:Cyclin N-terminal domain-containing protein n=1 Tax=Cryoendolithus antarcticus TaxID=1507870 RepID=A0A1V8SBL3_9PEZI|nr:hypothetical protein B0A48_17515 [Cryoendolithus antarcticus]